MKTKVLTLTLLAGIAFALPAAAQQNTTAAATYKDIEATLGSVPAVYKAVPEDAVAAIWAEDKALGASTTLPDKEKQLISLGVAAQIPCQYCIYFHTAAAKAAGATDAEVKAAVAQAAFIRQMSTIVNGAQVDFAEFKKETDAAMRFVADQKKAAK
jgi:AhpD family alkylhydroperoxidase